MTDEIQVTPVDHLLQLVVLGSLLCALVVAYLLMRWIVRCVPPSAEHRRFVQVLAAVGGLLGVVPGAKGDQIQVEGQGRFDKYTNKDNVEVTSFVVIGDTFDIVRSKDKGEDNAPASADAESFAAS